MLAMQGMKKKLRSIRSTQKLTKAMRTVAMVKFSKLSDTYTTYSKYGEQCQKVCKQYGEIFTDHITNPSASAIIFVVGSNKGLCGNFNIDILNFTVEKMKEMNSCLLYVCGKQLANDLKSKGIYIDKEIIMEDIPTYESTSIILDEMMKKRRNGEISEVHIIYSKYVNMMNQTVEMVNLFPKNEELAKDNALLIPDQATIKKNIGNLILKSMFYGFILETALGAQAATLMTMRTAYETASEYCEELEKEMHRMRQSAVTADVIETSGEWKER